MILSIIVPVYNEAETVSAVVKGLLNVKIHWKIEIIVVNDGSTDKTLERVEGLKSAKLKIISHPQNQGKGAALRIGMKIISGDFVST